LRQVFVDEVWISESGRRPLEAILELVVGLELYSPSSGHDHPPAGTRISTVPWSRFDIVEATKSIDDQVTTMAYLIFHDPHHVSEDAADLAFGILRVL
jgi:hypothetical protein